MTASAAPRPDAPAPRLLRGAAAPVREPDLGPLDPHDIGDFANPDRLVEAERGALAGCFIDGPSADHVLRTLAPTDFTGVRPAIFKALQLATTEGTADVSAVGTWLRENGHADGGEELIRVIGWVSMNADVRTCVAALKRRSKARRKEGILARLAGTDDSVTQQRLIAEFNALEAESEQSEKRFSFIGAGDLVESDVEAPRLLVADGLIVQGGMTVLAAMAKRGKTFTALDLSLSLVRRVDRPDLRAQWLGSDVCGAGPVVFLSGEGGPELMKARIQAMAPDLRREQLNRIRLLPTRPLPNLTIAADRRAIAAEIRAMGAALLVVDPFARCVPMADENDNAAMNAVLLPLRELAEETGCAILINHHMGHPKIGAARVVTGGRGASKIGDEADALINMEPDPDSTDRRRSVVRFACRWSEAPDDAIVAITNDPMGGLGLEFVARIGEAASGPRPGPEPSFSVAQLEQALMPYGTWRTRQDVADRLGVKEETLRKKLSSDRAGSIRAHLGKTLEMRVPPGRHKCAELRIVPLEERAGIDAKGGRS